MQPMTLSLRKALGDRMNDQLSDIYRRGLHYILNDMVQIWIKEIKKQNEEKSSDKKKKKDKKQK